MGIRSSSTAKLIFNDLKVPKENLLGKEGEGFRIAMATLDGGRIGIAAQALGIAQGAFEHALKYSRERVQFGKPICQKMILKEGTRPSETRTVRPSRVHYLRDFRMTGYAQSAQSPKRCLSRFDGRVRKKFYLRFHRRGGHLCIM